MRRVQTTAHTAESAHATNGFRGDPESMRDLCKRIDALNERVTRIRADLESAIDSFVGKVIEPDDNDKEPGTE